LVELAFAQDKSTKIKNGQSKWLLRELVKDFVNTEIALAPKRPLQTPQREWLSDNLKDWVASEIETIADLDWFNKKNLTSELNNFFNGDNDSSFHIWQWISVAQTLK
jgi:asparagine synthase (glutamine-hydrolysing)